MQFFKTITEIKFFVYVSLIVVKMSFIFVFYWGKFQLHLLYIKKKQL